MKHEIKNIEDVKFQPFVVSLTVENMEDLQVVIDMVGAMTREHDLYKQLLEIKEGYNS